MRIRWRDPETVLLPLVRTGIALVLLVPFATAPWTLYAFSIGKALYARVLIAVTFGLWAFLAFLVPRWRPPQSILLVALVAWLAVAILSAWFGVSPQHSFWSTYSRMQGVVNMAHWIAFAVVLAAVLRSESDWTRLLAANLVVGFAVAIFAIVRSTSPTALSFWGFEAYWPRISATTGNPIMLGAYLQAIALLACGFLVRSFCQESTQPTDEASKVNRVERRRVARQARKAGGRDPNRTQQGWGARLFWVVVAASAFWAVSLTGSLGALAGIAAGLGGAFAAYALFGRVRLSRRLGLAGFGAVFAVILAFVLALTLRGEGQTRAFDNELLERATSSERVGYTLGNRLRNWEAGMRAFADRPVLGWGADNYFVGSARHLSPPDGRAKVRDHAHNLFVEEAASKGAVGLAAWFLLWGLSAWVVLRFVYSNDNARERALAVFASAVLVGWFVQAQTSFYSASTWLQHMLMLGFVMYLETRLHRGETRWSRLLEKLTAPLHRSATFRRGVGVLATIAAVGLSSASLASSVAIHNGGTALREADEGTSFIVDMERAIAAFEPLATGPRIVLVNNVARNWELLAQHYPDEADRLLAKVDFHAAEALADEPESWVLHHALARFYAKVATSRPDYGTRAERHLARSLQLAPNLDPMEAPITRAAALRERQEVTP